MPIKKTIGLVAILAVAPALAHHSYAMFDGANTRTVSGTVAKLEWTNPHVFLWIYVPKPAGTGYDLYAFENGSVGVLMRLGWSKESFKAGDKVSVEYWPLKDGRPGGHFHKATYSNGTVIEGAGGPNVRPGAARPPEQPK